MKFRIGQRIRLLHEEGEGVITRLIDKSHVEIDLGDDFPLDVHINEIIAIDASESAYLGTGKSVEKSDSDPSLNVFGTSILDLSMVASRESDGSIAFWLVNPEPVQILFTCFTKFKHNYEGLSSGSLESGTYCLLFKLSQEQLQKTKSFFFQILGFSPGKGHPHAPAFKEVKWGLGALKSPSRVIPVLNKEGWVFTLREEKQSTDIKAIDDNTLDHIRKTDTSVVRPEKEVDLHIESLVARPYELAPSEMLKVQLQQVNKVLSEAVVHNYASVVFIHGLGQGTLKAAVKKVLEGNPHIKSFGPADPGRYGNGATKVIFF